MRNGDTRSVGKRKARRTGARSGPELQQRLNDLRTVPSEKYVVGQRVWVKVTSYCDWPGIIWNIGLCFKTIIPELVNSHTPGSVLVRFYGDQSSMFCKKSNIKPLEDDYDRRYKALKQWGKQDKKRDQKATWALEDLDMSVADCEAELQRMLQLQTSVLGARNGDCIVCALCEEPGAQMKCRICERYLHPLCLTPIALTPEDIPNGGHWLCPSCGEENHVNRDPAVVEEEKIERMGLTPDWIIHAGAFRVFQLQEPTPECPYIRGLLDPCTNSKIAPNIPAERLFDKNDDGLKLSNKWKGAYIVLNPDFKAHIQWRFVNRAIDEVENDSVPGVLLICRNSTDTAYFQRLMPYPRVLLRRNSIRFKDYDKTPIGFGIVVFCIVKHQYNTIIRRFMENFAPFGEPNVVIDKTWLSSPSFESLLGRLYQHANKHHRDHWVQCSQCSKWRIVSYEALLRAKQINWECKDLDPPYSSCDTIQTKAELQGARYAVLSEDKSLVHQEASATQSVGLHHNDGWTEHRVNALPPAILELLLQLNSSEVHRALEEGSQWQACAYTLSLCEGTLPQINGKMPTNSQLTALSRALKSKIMQYAPNMRIPDEGFVIKPVLVDGDTYNTVLKWIENLTVQSPEKHLPLKRPPPTETSIHRNLKKTKKSSEDVTEKRKEPHNTGPVKSGLELERELNKAKHRRLMDRVYHDSSLPESASMQMEELREAEGKLEIARQQWHDKELDEKRVIYEIIELEAALRMRSRECDEEYLQVENRMKTLQSQVELIRQTKNKS